MRHQLSQPARRMCRQPLQHLLQIHIRVQPVQPGRLQQTHHGGCTLARPQGVREQSVGASRREGVSADANLIRGAENQRPDRAVIVSSWLGFAKAIARNTTQQSLFAWTIRHSANSGRQAPTMDLNSAS